MVADAEPRLFPVDPADRDLIELDEAAAMAGETPETFWAQAGRIYPRPHGWPDPRKEYIKTRTGWRRGWRWRRGDVRKAIEERDRRSVFRH